MKGTLLFFKEESNIVEKKFPELFAQTMGNRYTDLSFYKRTDFSASNVGSVRKVTFNIVLLLGNVN